MYRHLFLVLYPLKFRSCNELQYFHSKHNIRIKTFLNLGVRLSPRYDISCMSASWKQLGMKTGFCDTASSVWAKVTGRCRDHITGQAMYVHLTIVVVEQQ